MVELGNRPEDSIRMETDLNNSSLFLSAEFVPLWHYGRVRTLVVETKRGGIRYGHHLFLLNGLVNNTKSRAKMALPYSV